ncbi:ABC transporter ATP-binding protein [Streptomyces odontomachi]|uniref:ABC transporter ATP-binding protein n=1 Tax=Streptomyces odontomachi TaxID=2944940 RepID=UPI002108964C|nr:ABC transporter ATP-binding protein [Streptomyces sp. ODS25]
MVATTPVIDIHDVSRTYGEGPPALADVTLRVRAGEALAVLGPSGSGKSTLLNLIARLDRPTSGSVTVDGLRVDELGEAAAARYRRTRIGMVFQFFNLLDDLTVTDNVLLPAQLAGMARAESRRRAAELLGRLGIDRHADAYPGRLSGGERQRVAVARALMNRPALLLADEPTGALDTASGEDVRDLLTALHADGQTIVLVTHDLSLAEACATRTVELVDGRIVRDVQHPPRSGHTPPHAGHTPHAGQAAGATSPGTSRGAAVAGGGTAGHEGGAR